MCSEHMVSKKLSSTRLRHVFAGYQHYRTHLVRISDVASSEWITLLDGIITEGNDATKYGEKTK